ncbi:urease accessory protein UreE [Parageobacillus thermoglucosidasius]|uniref:urease accessory protein UreE n=1 Tax=Parageobacillus thermoglucosidasius TaxID=1426 RepID=UPI000B54CD85|nr:urease accessory protein UreE [Parageobacillus thermoglucosidasius]REK54033.1 MAG: urease accessory protein UreE [Geobacillus sp.]MED4905898.1 urease accessory protein UreE [Parageobacillus thermoglucosidasius]MED4913499.1 urease accessory protein UreE [Parageobacillus thermoglucosidasius]MED4946584.1 urease accessory protein UreE [Parageobacillus thermoglucosidasius]MED4982171.1 urease accessory protein UreE [Parageobacillus thermoglucosidasius]
MIVEKIVGNIRMLDKLPPHIERVYLNSDDLVKRIQRVVTDHGTEIGIRLKETKELTDGDILWMDEKKMIVVSVLPDDLLVIRPTSMKQMGEIAHQLGNRHLPAQFEGEEMLVQYDYLVEELLKQLHIPYQREKRKVKQAFRYIGHRHDG